MTEDKLAHIRKLHRDLDSIAGIQDGWYEGEGFGPLWEVIGTAKRILSVILLDNDLGKCYIYPTVEGGAQAEWDVTDWTIQITFSNNRTIDCLAISVYNEVKEEGVRINYNPGEVIEDLVDKVNSWLKTVLSRTFDSVTKMNRWTVK